MKVVIGCLVLLLVAVVTPLTQEQKQKLEPYSKKCKLLSGVPDDMIQRARNGDFKDDIRMKLQMLCVMTEIGFVNLSGTPVVEKFMKSVKKIGADDKTAKTIVEKCVVKNGNPLETIFKVLKCLLGQKPNWSPV